MRPLTVEPPGPAVGALTAEHLPAVVERKYFVEIPGAGTVLALLDRLLPRDPEYPVSRMNTIYFDPPLVAAFGEPGRGFFRRGRLRLRWYGDAGQPGDESPVGCYLEAKFREGALRRKVRVPVALSGADLARPLASPRIRGLAGLGAGLSPLVRPGSVPSLLVSYRRDRFVDRATGARIALDSEICCPAWNGCSLPGRPVRFSRTVLETKSATGEIPRPLLALGSRLARRGFSKYLYFRGQLVERPRCGIGP